MKGNNIIFITLNLNIKFAGSIAGFKHISIELIRATKIGRKRTEGTKLKIAAANGQAQSIKVTDNKTGESKEFKKFIGIHHSYVSKLVKTQKFYRGKVYIVAKKQDN